MEVIDTDASGVGGINSAQVFVSGQDASEGTTPAGNTQPTSQVTPDSKSEDDNNKVNENLSAKVQGTNFYLDTDEIYALIESAVETVNRVGQASTYLQEEVSKLNPVTQQYATTTYKIDEKVTAAEQLSKDIVDYLNWVDEATKEVVEKDNELASGSGGSDPSSTYTPATYTPSDGGGSSGGGSSGGGLAGGGSAGGSYNPTTYTPFKYTPTSYTPYKYSPTNYTRTSYTPTTYTPYRYSPTTYTPYRYSPTTYTPYRYSPTTYTPYRYSPTAYTPKNYIDSIGSTLTTGSYGAGGGLGGNLAGTGDMNPEDAAALASLAGSSLLSVLASGTPKLASRLSPKTGAAGQKNFAKKTLAGAGLALGAASIAGGIYMGTKSGYYIFTPDDWEETEEDVQNAIIDDFIEAGMTPEEIEIFKESTYRIKASELNEHVKKVEKAFSIDEAVADEIIEMYHFSLFDENDDIDRYLLFLIMAIDGKNESADVNIYNILNPYFEEEDIDFIYTGINLEDYVYVEDEEEEEGEEEDIEVGQIEEE